MTVCFESYFGYSYYLASVHEVLVFCTACQPGFYRHSLEMEQCFKCPPKSFSRSPASTSCACIQGFFRTSTEDQTVACTSKSSKKGYIPPGREGGVWKSEALTALVKCRWKCGGVAPLYWYLSALPTPISLPAEVSMLWGYIVRWRCESKAQRCNTTSLLLGILGLGSHHPYLYWNPLNIFCPVLGYTLPNGKYS